MSLSPNCSYSAILNPLLERWRVFLFSEENFILEIEWPYSQITIAKWPDNGVMQCFLDSFPIIGVQSVTCHWTWDVFI